MQSPRLAKNERCVSEVLTTMNNLLSAAELKLQPQTVADWLRFWRSSEITGFG